MGPGYSKVNSTTAAIKPRGRQLAKISAAEMVLSFILIQNRQYVSFLPFPTINLGGKMREKQ